MIPSVPPSIAVNNSILRPPNNLYAIAVLSTLPSKLFNASATNSNCANKSPFVALTSSCEMPNCSNASLAIPVPLTNQALIPIAIVRTPLENASKDVPP